MINLSAGIWYSVFKHVLDDIISIFFVKNFNTIYLFKFIHFLFENLSVNKSIQVIWLKIQITLLIL